VRRRAGGGATRGPGASNCRALSIREPTSRTPDHQIHVIPAHQAARPPGLTPGGRSCQPHPRWCHRPARARAGGRSRLRREGRTGLVARFGGIPLEHGKRAVIRDPAPAQNSYPQRADPAPQAGMRAVRGRHHSGRPPDRRAQTARQTGPASPRGPPSWPRRGARSSTWPRMLSPRAAGVWIPSAAPGLGRKGGRGLMPRTGCGRRCIRADCRRSVLVGRVGVQGPAWAVPVPGS